MGSGSSRRAFLLSFFFLLIQIVPSFDAAAEPVSFDCACKAVPAKPAIETAGTLSALVLFAKFRGEVPGSDAAPSWAAGLFDGGLPGSFAHFYTEMSGGRLQVEGQVLPRRYSAPQAAAAYLAETPGSLGKFGQFNLEILEQADADADFGRFDNDGPDGVPNSGDDDGYVDIVFVNLLTVPKDFLVGTATGLASLGLDTDYISDDPAAGGDWIRIRSRFTGFGGTTQRGHTFSVTAATMCHEFGHIMGLVDLFDQSSVAADGQLDPAEDSAGIGRWGLMGLGTLGWGVEDGPNAFSAWSLAQLGWVEVVEVTEPTRDLMIEDMIQGGRIYKIPLTREEYFLLENRQAAGSYYNRNVPASGLLIWHVDERADNDEEQHKQVDLVCADGLYADRGFPGGQPDPVAGRDNLDFWAKDGAYVAAHNGNRGDATDPFDGVRFTRFAHDANPGLSAHTGFSRNLPLSVAVENIRGDGGRMVVDVLRSPPLIGHVTADTVWSGVVDAVGDVVVEPGVKLTLEAGTQVRFASFDWSQSGFDANLCELLVFGQLDIQGTSAQPVRFTASQSRSRWAGIFLLDGQDPGLEQVTVENSFYGLVRFRLPPGVTRWSGLQRIPLDLVVPADAELVVDPGAVVQFGADLGRRGAAANLTELIVDGRLSVEGEASRPVLFTADPLQSDAFWYGVRVRPEAQVDARFLQIDRAGFGFSGEVAAEGRLRIADSWIGTRSLAGLRLKVNGQAEVERAVFTGNAGQAIRIEGSGRLELRQVNVVDNGQEGIFLGNASLVAEGLLVGSNGRPRDAEDPRSGLRAVGGRGQRIELVGSRIADNWRHGLELDGWEGSLELRDTEILDNREDGVRAVGLEGAIMERVTVGQNAGRGAAISDSKVEIRGGSFVDNVGAGLALKDGSTGRVEDSEFRGAPGMEVEACDSLLVRGDLFAAGALGLVSRNATPRVEDNRFADNGIALQVRGSRVPVAVRRNIFFGNTTAVENLSSVTLSAQENFWGTTDSTAIAALITGPVTWTPFLEREPDQTAVEETDALPAQFALELAYPNPFNSQTVIPFSIPAADQVELVVYDALGRLVRRLVDNTLEPGTYLIGWDGRDERGMEAASGAYFVRLRAGDRVASGRLALVR